jgi:predicted protein tyrosine phosphatase
MGPIPVSLLTICGLSELDHHRTRGVTHVLSILDPDWPDPEPFGSYDPHQRTTLRFHDVVEPGPGLVLPRREHVERIVAFGQALREEAAARSDAHLLVHCHMGISRSTAAMATVLAQADPEAEADAIFAHIGAIRPQAWPNSVMIGFADELLDRGGRLTAALARFYARQLARRPETGRELRSIGRAREVEMGEAARRSAP